MIGMFSNLSRIRRLTTTTVAVVVLSGCADGQMPAFLQARSDSGADVVSRASTTDARSAARDVEAPEIFQASEAGLWDGRPSLGGVWVAHPDVEEPERAVIRNQDNGQFVIGALFRKERETPGPRLQVSSDAAASLGLLAGQPTNLDVVALRREETPETEPAAPLAEPVSAVPLAPEVTEGALDPVVDGASAAIEASVTPPETTAEETPVDPAPAPTASDLDRPYIQIGIFSVEQNAKNTATAMRQAGMLPTVKTQSSQGKTFWRVVVGPAQSEDERATLLKTIKGTGFNDAYAVSD